MVVVDVITEIDLGILRGAVNQRMNPPKQVKEEPPRTTTKELDRLSQLEIKLEEQLEEQEKWEALTRKLERKAQEMASTVIRLDTSVKVFRGELAQRNQSVILAQDRVDSKRNEQRKELEKLLTSKEKQLELAQNAKTIRQETIQELEQTRDRQDQLDKKLRAARSSLMPLEERVQNLETNLNGNRGMSDSQRFYYSAEHQVEREQRDQILKEIHAIYKELEQVDQKVGFLQGKMGLYQDEEQRRILKAKALDKEMEETKEFFWNQLSKLEAQVDSIGQDRDEWEEKTNKLAEDLEHTKVESSKLTVKARLFNQQLQGIQANVNKLKELIEETRETRSDTSDSSDDDEEEDNGGLQPESNPAEEEPYVWKPIQKSDVGLGPVQPKVPTPSKTTYSYYTPAAVRQSSSPAAVKANHAANVQEEPSESSTSSAESAAEPVSTSPIPKDSGLAVQLRHVQRDLEQQKRFQKEQALKVDQQISRLVAKMDVLVNNASTPVGQVVSNASAESQLSTLKHQMQSDAMRDANDIRQLMQQVARQCEQLTQKVEDLTRDGERREHDQAVVERKMREREQQYAKQLDDLQSEMQRQMERQQQIFAERMSQAMMQMEKFVEGGDRDGAMRDDSMASFESLAPLDASSRKSSRNSLTDDENDEVRRPGGYSMVQKGIAVGNSPLFRGKSF